MLASLRILARFEGRRNLPGQFSLANLSLCQPVTCPDSGDHICVCLFPQHGFGFPVGSAFETKKRVPTPKTPKSWSAITGCVRSFQKTPNKQHRKQGPSFRFGRPFWCFRPRFPCLNGKRSMCGAPASWGPSASPSCAARRPPKKTRHGRRRSNQKVGLRTLNPKPWQKNLMGH